MVTEIMQNQTYYTKAVEQYNSKIHFNYLQKFNLEACSKKPEVDIMPSLVSEAQVIQWQCNQKQLSHSAEN